MPMAFMALNIFVDIRWSCADESLFLEFIGIRPGSCVSSPFSNASQF